MALPRTAKLVLGLGLVAVCALTAGADAAARHGLEPARLSLELPADQDVMLRIEVEGRFRELMLDGSHLSFEHGCSVALEIPGRVTKGQRPGARALRLSVQRVHGKTVGPEGERSFDTASAEEDGRGGRQPWAELLGASFAATLTASGDIEGFRFTQTPPEPQDPARRRSRKRMLESLPRFLKQMTCFLPSKAVDAGETWLVKPSDVDGAGAVLWHHPARADSGMPREVKCELVRSSRREAASTAMIRLEDGFLERAVAEGRILVPSREQPRKLVPRRAPYPPFGGIRMAPGQGIYLDQTVRLGYSWDHIGGINREHSGRITTRIRLTTQP